ncbi:MAG: helix-turn-helix domain-containing protein [Hyphomicrobiaceae bacterium]|nr:helix-turn-helix domain-containing protein [Hyphomicrobiaceae bacterium]
MRLDLAGDELLTTSEAAEKLRLSVPSLERYRLLGTGPAYSQLGGGKRGRIVYRRADLDAYLLACRKFSTSAKP